MSDNSVTVYVKVPHRTYILHLQRSDCVFRVNEFVGNKEKIPSFRVRTLFKGNALDKNNTLEHYQISSGTVLTAEFLLFKEINIYVKINRDNRCSKYVLITVENTSTLNDVKLVVEKLEGIEPSEQIISHCGRIYSSRSICLFETDIKDGSIINLDVCSDSKQRICSKESSRPNVDNFCVKRIMSSFQKIPRKPVEIVFSIVSDEEVNCLNRMKINIREICERLLSEIVDVRIALMMHGSHGDYKNNVFSGTKFTTKPDKIVEFLQSTPETTEWNTSNYEWILHKTQDLDWSDNSYKMLIVIGDCEPHPPSLTKNNIDWHSELDALNRRGIQVFCGLSENFLGSIVDDFYPELCKKTHGCLINQGHLKCIADMLISEFDREGRDQHEDNLSRDLEKITPSDKACNGNFESQIDENNNSNCIISEKCSKVEELDDKSPQLRFYSEHDTNMSNFNTELVSSQNKIKCKESKKKKRKIIDPCVVM